MAELKLTIHPSKTWPSAYEAITPAGEVLAVGRDIAKHIALRIGEEFPDRSIAASYEPPTT